MILLPVLRVCIHIFFQDQAGCHLIDHFLPVLLPHAGLLQDLIRRHRGEALVLPVHRQSGAPFKHHFESLAFFHTLSGSPVHVEGPPQHDPPDAPLRGQLLQSGAGPAQLVFTVSGDGLRRLSREIQGIAEGDAHRLRAVIQPH